MEIMPGRPRHIQPKDGLSAPRVGAVSFRSMKAARAQWRPSAAHHRQHIVVAATGSVIISNLSAASVQLQASEARGKAVASKQQSFCS
jgi:hypothetical protein